MTVLLHSLIHDGRTIGSNKRLEFLMSPLCPSTVLLSSALALTSMTTSTFAFTGDVTQDFFSPDVVMVLDALDVGIPVQAPAGTVSGWDVVAILFELDGDNDLIRIGLDFEGIAGDADGDGDASSTSAWLASNGGVDLPNLGGTESICMAFDFDQDLIFDLIVGVSAETDYSGFTAAYYNDSSALLPFAFGTSAPEHLGEFVIGPDFEFELTNLMALDPYEESRCVGSIDVTFNFAFFAGSFEDDGIGEDFGFAEISLHKRCANSEDLTEEFSLRANHPNPFNPSTQISFNMNKMDQVKLDVYNMQGQKVSTLVDGTVSSGTHEVTFDGSHLTSGVYFYTLETSDAVETRKMVLMK